MADHRPFPPSARRRSLARAAGLTSASPWVSATAAWLAMVVALLVLGRVAATGVGSWVADACRAPAGVVVGGRAMTAGDAFASIVPAAGSARDTGDARVSTAGAASIIESPASLVGKLLALALPLLVAAGLAALIAHLVQARGVWLPRRKLRGAPVLETSRARDAVLGVAGAAAIGGTAVGWLWVVAPRLARAIDAPELGATMVVGFIATLAAVWVALAAIDALVRRADLERSLRMTSAEKREDDRLSGADPRWRARRAEAARGPALREAVAGAAVVLLADGIGVAVAWDPLRRPIPVRTAVGRDARATQLLGLARRHAVPVHRDVALATALAAGDGPVPEVHWARLAEIVAATRGRARSI